MKMSRNLFLQLRADCARVADYEGKSLEWYTTMRAAWDTFHRINRDRSYDDTHPGYVQGVWTRVLVCNRAPGNPWIDQFYKRPDEGGEDLNDDHIETALRMIFPNLKSRRN